MKSLGLPFAVEPKTSPSSLSPIPQVLLLVDRRNSSFDTRMVWSLNLVDGLVLAFPLTISNAGGCFIGGTFVDSESPKTLSESLLFDSVDDRPRGIVALHTVNPVIKPVLEIAYTAVCIA